MKKLLWVVIALVGVNNVASAQSKWGEDSVKCRENLYIYYELAKSKNYDEAYEPWTYVFENCPASSKNNVIFGPRIVEAKLKAATTPEEKAKLTAMLYDVYDTRIELYPDDEAYALERKGLDMVQHSPDSLEKTYDIFKRALELSNEHSAAFYNAYFITAARLFNADIFEIKDVFFAYSVVQEGLEYNTDVLNREITSLQAKVEDSTITDKETKELEKAERELGRFDDVVSNNEKVLGPIATCEKLTLIYNEESFAANKTDATWLRRAAKMLSRERENDEGETVDCTDDPIFFKIAEALYKLEPSPTSARAVGTIALKNKDYSKGIEYLKEAANGEADPRKQSSDYLRIATTYQKMGSLANAKAAALKAASYNKKSGTPYIILATIYAQADGQCGSNVFEKKAVYWAAIDKLKYAKSIDPSMANKANKLIAAYKGQLPDKSIIFQLGKKEGDKYSIGCFIGETITVDYNL
ncbi:hypothetical protein Oweho_0082 [Owenweeksia hongkongensis DSM 17368]|uniref:Tetratricopeptide repeat protein n=1 Tax=Owenweeksia hongkongensis (strain DSM 17368 / CIP 108786 / JCM 12287 / NRRL B-23963 / UST20020801) TaxID=926562 RepID=G8R5V6_OWEHD|nr:hypothetical protein [Owenweeksia hongkongensis]AEV31104.1 hypothetical protein Oweho_0082 [Owenweeksia hongkongensis DSM 17368]